jgi:hypothetical protein
MKDISVVLLLLLGKYFSVAQMPHRPRRLSSGLTRGAMRLAPQASAKSLVTARFRSKIGPLQL